MADTIKLVNKQAAQYKWIIVGLAAIALLLYLGQNNPKDSFFFLPTPAWYLLIVLVVVYYATRRKQHIIECGFDAVERIRVVEAKEIGEDWDLTSPTILTFGNLFLIQGEGSPCWCVDCLGNIKSRSFQNILAVLAHMEQSEILRRSQLANVERLRVKEALSERGIELQDERHQVEEGA